MRKDELMDKLKQAKKGIIEDQVLKGINFEKSGIQYMIMEYSSVDDSAVLLRQSDEKYIIAFSFPYLKTLNWITKDSFINEKDALKRFENRNKTLNIME